MRKLVRILILLLAASCTSQEAVPTDVLPDIWPDYAGVTIPRSIAPLNFEVRVADAVQAVLSNGSREVRVRGSFVGIPLRKWRSLTAAGDSLTVQVKARIDGQWRAYLPLSIHLSDDPVDLSLVYRRVDPGYETYARMGIYQRDLASFREKALFENTRIDPGCVNCHSFAHCDPASMQLHFRGGKGGTLIHSEAYGSDVYNMSNPLTLGAVYPYWHPSGRYIAYSVNDIRQSFHNLPSKVLEVYDLESDVVLYDVETRTVLVEPLLQDSTAFEPRRGVRRFHPDPLPPVQHRIRPRDRPLRRQPAPGLGQARQERFLPTRLLRREKPPVHGFRLRECLHLASGSGPVHPGPGERRHRPGGSAQQRRHGKLPRLELQFPLGRLQLAAGRWTLHPPVHCPLQGGRPFRQFARLYRHSCQTQGQT